MRRGTLPFAAAAVGMTLAASLSACTPSSPAATSGSGGEVEVSDAALVEEEGSEADVPIVAEVASTAVDARAIAHELAANDKTARMSTDPKPMRTLPLPLGPSRTPAIR